MTTSTNAEVAKRKRRATSTTIGGDFAGELRARAEKRTHSWPSARYRTRPVEFCHEVLGSSPWSKQIEILEAVRDHKRVAVASGHKVGKSNTAAKVALWFYASFDDARVVMSSTTARQVEAILWRELRMEVARSGRCVDCKKAELELRPCPHSALLDGELNELARSGLKSEDFREIVGFTAREAEAVAGVSGKNLLYIIDEASGVPDVIFEAIEGNRAGGARILLLGNPTRTEGEFYEAFSSKSDLYKTFTVSSEESPNVVEDREVIPGLATREWVEEKKIEWGEDSPIYRVRVKGLFALHEDGKILSLHLVSQAQRRWEETEARGRFQLGIDPAGPGLGGDETAMAGRRGLKMTSLVTFRGLSDEGHVAHAMGILAENRQPGDERPLIVVDREGPDGWKVYSALQGMSERYRRDPARAFDVVGVRASDGASRQPRLYDRARDELWANGAAWLREGGALLDDDKLTKELHAPRWEQQVNGKLKVTPKRELRKELKRSPDRADAFLLSVWEPSSYHVGSGDGHDAYDDEGVAIDDAYQHNGIDPYRMDGGPH